MRRPSQHPIAANTVCRSTVSAILSDSGIPISPAVHEQPGDVQAHCEMLHGAMHREYACPEDQPDRISDWRETARPALRRLLGLERIAADVGTHEPAVELGEPERLAGEPVTRRLGYIQVEPTVRLPFYLLVPDGPGPHPLAIMPHGHDQFGIYAGVVNSEADRQRMLAEDRDVALQAARRGMIAIAPATRGLDGFVIRNLEKRKNRSDCNLHLYHCLLAGRSAVGERVWDAERLLDWAMASLDVDPRYVLAMGNSGGGVATLFMAACDPRVTISVASCSYTPWFNRLGMFMFCPCNLVPGITRFGEIWDVAALIAPRWFQCVHGRADRVRLLHEAAAGVEPLTRIYQAMGVPARLDHRIGEGGHRFFSDLMWPFIDRAIAAIGEAEPT